MKQEPGCAMDGETPKPGETNGATQRQLDHEMGGVKRKEGHETSDAKPQHVQVRERRGVKPKHGCGMDDVKPKEVHETGDGKPNELRQPEHLNPKETDACYQTDREHDHPQA